MLLVQNRQGHSRGNELKDIFKIPLQTRDAIKNSRRPRAYARGLLLFNNQLKSDKLSCYGFIQR